MQENRDLELKCADLIKRRIIQGKMYFTENDWVVLLWGSIFSFVLCRTGCCLLNIISEIDTGDFCYKVLTLMLKFARVFHLKVNFKSICNKNVQCSLICSCFSSQFSQSVHRMVRAVLCEFVSLEQYFFYTILYIFVWFALRYMYMYMC